LTQRGEGRAGLRGEKRAEHQGKLLLKSLKRGARRRNITKKINRRVPVQTTRKTKKRWGGALENRKRQRKNGWPGG